VTRWSAAASTYCYQPPNPVCQLGPSKLRRCPSEARNEKEHGQSGRVRQESDLRGSGKARGLSGRGLRLAGLALRLTLTGDPCRLTDLDNDHSSEPRKETLEQQRSTCAAACNHQRTSVLKGASPSFAAVAFEGEEGTEHQKHNRHRRENAGALNGFNRDRGEPGRK